MNGFLSQHAIPESTKNGIDPSKTRREFTKVVYPRHTNPSGNTFGGVMLQWIEESCYLTAASFSKQRSVRMTGLSKVFRAPSTTADILTFKTQVNRVFEHTLVVGCRVEQVHRGEAGPPAHIGTAWLTLHVDDPEKLQPVFPDTSEDRWRFYHATVSQKSGRFRANERED